MKLINPGPFEADVPALGVVGVKPGDAVTIDDRDIAGSLLRQGWRPPTRPRRRKTVTPEEA